jgi:hypothetical protein
MASNVWLLLDAGLVLANVANNEQALALIEDFL